MDVMTLDTKGGEYSYVSENVAKILPSREISYMSNTDDYNKFNTLSNELFGYSLEEKGLQNIPRPN
jgi:hypothetical protein